MEKERKIKTLSLVALIVAVLGLSIAFAALSSVLKVKGTTFIGTEDLYVHFVDEIPGFEGIKLYMTNGIYKGEMYDKNSSNVDQISTVNISDDLNTINFTAKFMLPGDYVEISAPIKNEGNIDAVISGFEYGTPVCVSDTGNEEDERLICDNIVYHTEYHSPDKDYNGELKNGIEISAGSRNADTVKFKVTLNENLDKVPSSNVTVSNLSLKINYAQK